jgi:hypothetical protein
VLEAGVVQATSDGGLAAGPGGVGGGGQVAQGDDGGERSTRCQQGVQPAVAVGRDDWILGVAGATRSTPSLSSGRTGMPLPSAVITRASSGSAAGTCRVV